LGKVSLLAAAAPVIYVLCGCAEHQLLLANADQARFKTSGHIDSCVQCVHLYCPGDTGQNVLGSSCSCQHQAHPFLDRERWAELAAVRGC
jgi:hypothetical protein